MKSNTHHVWIKDPAWKVPTQKRERVRVIESQERKPGPPAWLMIRRSVEDPSEIKYYLSNAPETISLAEMAWAGCQRWSIEVDFKLAKGEVGLDQYEITKYRGWYHHITLSLMALFFLKKVQKQWGEKKIQATVPEIRKILEVVLPRMEWDEQMVLAW